MMGRREDRQVQFLYAFDLDKVVPPDHLVRQIDGVLDLSWVHKELAPYYSHTGRPSIDPVLMIRMLLVGYVFALRSERRLCSEVQVADSAARAVILDLRQGGPCRISCRFAPEVSGAKPEAARPAARLSCSSSSLLDMLALASSSQESDICFQKRSRPSRTLCSLQRDQNWNQSFTSTERSQCLADDRAERSRGIARLHGVTGSVGRCEQIANLD